MSVVLCHFTANVVMCQVDTGNSFNSGTVSTGTSVSRNAHVDGDTTASLNSGNVEFVEQVQVICLVVSWSSPSFGYKKYRVAQKNVYTLYSSISLE